MNPIWEDVQVNELSKLQMVVCLINVFHLPNYARALKYLISFISFFPTDSFPPTRSFINKKGEQDVSFSFCIIHTRSCLQLITLNFIMNHMNHLRL